MQNYCFHRKTDRLNEDINYLVSRRMTWQKDRLVFANQIKALFISLLNFTVIRLIHYQTGEQTQINGEMTKYQQLLYSYLSLYLTF